MNQVITKIINKLLGFFSDHPDSLSMMRAIMWLTCTSIVLTWVIMSFMKGMILDVPSGVVLLFATAVGGKAGQKMIEQYFNKQTDTTTPTDDSGTDETTEQGDK